jgi:hypothetical protein
MLRASLVLLLALRTCAAIAFVVAAPASVRARRNGPPTRAHTARRSRWSFWLGAALPPL